MALGTDFSTGAIKAPDVGQLFTNYSKTQAQKEAEAKERARLDQLRQDSLTQQELQNKMGQDRLLLSQKADARADERMMFEQSLKDPNSPLFQKLREAQIADENRKYQAQLDLAKKKYDYMASKSAGKDTRTPQQKNYEYLLSQNVSPDEAYKTIFGKKGSSDSNKDLYTRKDIDKVLGTKDAWTFFGGSKNEALGKINKLEGVLRNAKVPQKQIDNILGKALTRADEGETFNKDMFDQITKNEIANLGILTETPKVENTSQITKQVTEPTPTQEGFQLPDIGRTLVAAEIKNDIKSLREGGLFSRPLIESAIKTRIDAKYGNGAYDAMSK